MKQRKERLCKRERQRENERIIWHWDTEENFDEEPDSREKEKLLSDEEFFTEERMRRGKIKGIIVIVVFILICILWFFIQLRWRYSRRFIS